MSTEAGAELALAVSNKWDELVGPMLAHAWDEGYAEGLQDGDYASTGDLNDETKAQNPYREVSSD